MTLFDCRTTPAQLRAAADWSESGEGVADVLLLVDDRMLVVYQGDEKTAFDTDGTEGSEEYISLAPLTPKHDGWRQSDPNARHARQHVEEN